MVINVGINGFGRIGRIVFRSIIENEDIAVTAINDPAIDAQYICYLIKFDSTHGKFKGSITPLSNEEILVNGKIIKVFKQKQPSAIKWNEARVHYVVETTGMFTTLEKASGHLKRDVKCVIVTSPSADIPMLVLGVNEADIPDDAGVVSCTSSTLYCLALIGHLLEGCGGVKGGFVTCVHAMTSSLKPLDGLCIRGKHWRDNRSISQNIIPTKTGICKAVARVLPELAGRLSGLVYRVPIVDVSVLDLTVSLNSLTTLKEIISKVEEAGATTMKNVIRVSNECAVSSDFIGDSHSCILDVASCQQMGDDFFRLVCWYDNEYSYACRVVDTIRFCERQLGKARVSAATPKVLCDCSKKNNGGNPKRLLPSISNEALKIEVIKPAEKAEVFKICDDKSHKSLRKVEKCFSTEAHERLAKVKQEFQKMVHKTEDLLKKSQSYNLGSAEKYSLAAESSDKIKNNERAEKVVSLLRSPYIDSYSGDYKLTNNLKNPSRTYSKTSISKIIMKCTDHIRVSSRHENSKRPSTSSEEEFLKYEKACESRIINLDADKSSVETLKGKKSQSRFIKLKDAHDQELKAKVVYKANTKYNQQTKVNDEIKETSLPIQTIVAPNKHVVAGEDDDILDCTKECNLMVSVKDRNSTTERNKRRKQDILEKLDSSSDTDSELSLRLRERKSQVIDLSDLTISHDNLQRLDKICRIIEISDELSDRLFLPLNKTEKKSMEWSFKELCDEIKLDEFCDNVFGKSVL